MTQYKLVPVEPTEEMIRAMEREWITGSSIDMAKREYKAMLATAPQPAQEPVAWCNRAAYDAMRAGVGPTVAILRERPGFHMALYAAPTQAAPVAELVEALEDLLLNVLEAMKTGGWVPTPLHRSFWDATNNAQGALARYQEAKP